MWVYYTGISVLILTQSRACYLKRFLYLIFLRKSVTKNRDWLITQNDKNWWAKNLGRLLAKFEKIQKNFILASSSTCLKLTYVFQIHLYTYSIYFLLVIHNTNMPQLNMCVNIILITSSIFI
jgi:hypothetical protein